MNAIVIKVKCEHCDNLSQQCCVIVGILNVYLETLYYTVRIILLLIKIIKMLSDGITPGIIRVIEEIIATERNSEVEYGLKSG